MNNEDMSDIIQKLSSMMNNSTNANVNTDNSTSTDIPSGLDETSFNNLQNILSNINSNSQGNNNSNNSENDSNNFNFDFETIMKVKNIMEKFNSTKNSSDANLLMSLKPFLNNNRKQKLDTYIQFLSITKVLEAFNTNGGVNK